MRRHQRIVLSISISVCVAIAALGIRSYWCWDRLAFQVKAVTDRHPSSYWVTLFSEVGGIRFDFTRAYLDGFPPEKGHPGYEGGQTKYDSAMEAIRFIDKLPGEFRISGIDGKAEILRESWIHRKLDGICSYPYVPAGSKKWQIGGFGFAYDRRPFVTRGMASVQIMTTAFCFPYWSLFLLSAVPPVIVIRQHYKRRHQAIHGLFPVCA
ncbi:MAG: hypothetical protein IT443_03820 [Phycisphaeraceae bacterium]|nr:hypothetical protein [Phycisphaeraceae bacterium]